MHMEGYEGIHRQDQKVVWEFINDLVGTRTYRLLLSQETQRSSLSKAEISAGNPSGESIWMLSFNGTLNSAALCRLLHPA